MSKVDLNVLVNGLSGKVGKAVLRRRGSQVILGSNPKKRISELKPGEIAQRERFRRAAAYAKAKLKDPVAKAEYAEIAKQKEFMTAFTVAVKDYLVSPKMDSLKVDNYKGNINDPISIGVSDDFKIISVQVTITSASDVLIESGIATFDPGSLEWKYAATVANASLAGTKIRAVATDRPGNETSLEAII